MRTLRSKSESLLQSIAKPFGLFGSLLAIVSHIDEGRGQGMAPRDMSHWHIQVFQLSKHILISPFIFHSHD